MLDLFGCRLRAVGPRCRRDDGGMGVETFQVQGQCDLWAIQARVGSAAGGANKDVVEVLLAAGIQSMDQA